MIKSSQFAQDLPGFKTRNPTSQETLVSRQTRMDGHLTHRLSSGCWLRTKHPFKRGRINWGRICIQTHSVAIDRIQLLQGCESGGLCPLWRLARTCPESFALSYPLCQGHCVRRECLQDESTVFVSLTTKSHSIIFAEVCLLKSSH